MHTHTYINISSALRTVSTDPALVISRMMPLQLVADIVRWVQMQWSSGRNPDPLNKRKMDQQTHNQEISDWTGRKHIRTRFYLGQLLIADEWFKTHRWYQRWVGDLPEYSERLGIWFLRFLSIRI